MKDLQTTRPPPTHRPLSLPCAIHAPNPLIPMALEPQNHFHGNLFFTPEIPTLPQSAPPAAKSFINHHLPNNTLPRHNLRPYAAPGNWSIFSNIQTRRRPFAHRLLCPPTTSSPARPASASTSLTAFLPPPTMAEYKQEPTTSPAAHLDSLTRHTAYPPN